MGAAKGPLGGCLFNGPVIIRTKSIKAPHQDVVAPAPGGLPRRLQGDLGPNGLAIGKYQYLHWIDFSWVGAGIYPAGTSPRLNPQAILPAGIGGKPNPRPLGCRLSVPSGLPVDIYIYQLMKKTFGRIPGIGHQSKGDIEIELGVIVPHMDTSQIKQTRFKDLMERIDEVPCSVVVPRPIFHAKEHDACGCS